MRQYNDDDNKKTYIYEIIWKKNNINKKITIIKLIINKLFI